MNVKYYLNGLLAGIFTLALAISAQGETKSYEIDTSHSNIVFKVRHFLTPTSGSFGDFTGKIDFDAENPENSSVEATIKVASIDTNDAKRDKHLMNKDFFLEEQHPVVTFKSTRWNSLGNNRFEVTGNLTILDKTLPVKLDTELVGTMEHPRKPGKTVSGWTASTTIDRTAWGINYGQGVIGNDVSIEINIEAIGE